MRAFPWFTRKPTNPARLRLEALEERTLLSASVAFDAATGWLAIHAGPTGAAVQVGDNHGALAVSIDGQSVSSPATVRRISLSGGGAADSLTLANLTTANALTVSSDGSLTLAGTVRAGSLTASANDFMNLGQVRAGHIAITAGDYLNAGTLAAGGVVQVHFSQSYIDTAAALTRGSTLLVDGATTGRLFSSGRFDATGTTGGRVDLSGQSVALVAAHINASGTAAGGQVVVRSQASTDFAGTISARGSKGGFIEVSSHGTLTDTGKADAGPGGTLRLDPANLVVSAPPVGVFPQYQFINPGTGGTFGSQVVTLPTGNVVVTDPSVNNNAGAIYLFNGQSGALISTLKGSAGSVTVLSNGNFVVDDPSWNGGQFNGEGAVTWGSGTTGITGNVSAGNSLVGSAPGDLVGSSGVTALANGNYVVDSPDWNGGNNNGLGAVTWGNGATGITGTISAGNSLVGSAPGDVVGSTAVRALSNGNYVVASPNWNGNRGAATWASGTAGLAGTISSSNSLVGSAPGDVVGDGLGNTGNGVTALSNGNYVVGSPGWNGGQGAATWGDGTTGITGTISAGNSLVGSATDLIGGIVYALNNGNYVVCSPEWSLTKGAATWGNGTTGITGVVSASNSLVGSSNVDQVGAEVTVLSNGNYVVDSEEWNDGRGAATWGNGTTGITGIVSASNSLVGSSYDDLVGLFVIPLSNGNYVVDSSYWNGGISSYGAVTWGNGTTGITGTVSASNSLVGSAANDQVGAGGVTALSNGNYVVASPFWNGGMLKSLGAATWGNGSTGITGTISASNSLVGSSPGDAVGGLVTALSNGNYVVLSPNWNQQRGATTWGNGTTGITGTIAASNSLIGSSGGDRVGSGITALSNGNYVVASPSWNNRRGAATWGNGTTGITGTLSASNSLVGSAAGDQVGNTVTALSNGNYVVASPSWNGNRGAATWADGTSGTTLDGLNTIDAQNSITGTVANAGLGSIQPGTLPGSFLASFVTDNGGLVTAGLLDPNRFTTALAQGQTITITPAFLAHTLDAGTAVTLRASNTLTISSPITVSAHGHGGALTLQDATLLLDAGISTDGGALTLGGNVSPGGSKTALVHVSASKVAFLLHSSYTIQLNGTTPGKGYDQLGVSGVVDIRNATLHVSSRGHFARGQTFILVQDNRPITTTFAGLREGSFISAGGQKLKVSYKNDRITLTVQ
jgi:hypothetical protein